MHSFLRLLRHAAPYRERLAIALGAMGIYAVASAGLTYLIKPIFDSVLPNRSALGWVATAIVVVYVAKGLGSFCASYLMTDIGQRVVRDLRELMFSQSSASRPGSSRGARPGS